MKQTAEQNGIADYQEYFRLHRQREGEPNSFQLDKACSFVSRIARSCSRPRVVADLGCGIGLFALELARRGWQVIAVDECADSIVIGRRITTSEHVGRLVFRVAPIQQLTDENFADLTLLWGGILGYQSRAVDQQIMSVAARSVSRGGSLAVMLFNPVFFTETKDQGVLFDRFTHTIVVLDERERPLLNVAVRSVEEIRGWALTEICGEETIFLWDNASGELPVKEASSGDWMRHRYLIWVTSKIQRKDEPPVSF